jgi:hypothetical protein
MNPKKYKYISSDDYLDYEFDSEGSKGRFWNLHGISLMLWYTHVYGYKPDNGWRPFRKNVNYDAFLIKRK